MTGEVSIPAFIRPLAMPALDEFVSWRAGEPPAEVALSVLCDLLEDRNEPVEAAHRRYKDVTDPATEPPIAPHHDTIMRHVFRPLKEAKQCYVLGMPVACIAQAGLVGEMVALWRFRMLAPKLDDRPLDGELQKLLLGREFDKMGQEERIRVLRAVDNLDHEVVHAFGQLRGLRRQYLHFMVDASRDVDRDAREALAHACLLVSRTLGMTIVNGAFAFPPRVMHYIRDILHVSDTDQPATEAGKDPAA